MEKKSCDTEYFQPHHLCSVITRFAQGPAGGLAEKLSSYLRAVQCGHPRQAECAPVLRIAKEQPIPVEEDDNSSVISVASSQEAEGADKDDTDDDHSVRSEATTGEVIPDESTDDDRSEEEIERALSSVKLTNNTCRKHMRDLRLMENRG